MQRRRYEIVVRGSMDAVHLDGMEIVSTTASDTRLRGWIADQSALQGLLVRIASCGLVLISAAPTDE